LLLGGDFDNRKITNIRWIQVGNDTTLLPSFLSKELSQKIFTENPGMEKLYTEDAQYKVENNFNFFEFL